jgi:hypothetical protein
MRYLVAILLTVLNCASEKPDASDSIDLTTLKAKYETYLSLSSRHQGDSGFVHARDCDSLLFSGLYSFAGGGVEILAAQEEPGKWHRTPAQDCYPDRSKSTVSRDMLLGLLFHALKHKDGSIPSDLISYGQSHKWIMGEGQTSRTWLNPVFRKTLALMDRKLSGSNHQMLMYPPYIWVGGLKGYQAHLAVLHILLIDLTTGKIDTSAKGRIKEQYERVPGNALFSYAYHRYFGGDQAGTLSILMDERIFPSERLPHAEDRCQPYLWQRDPDEWGVCEGEEHPGVDFLFVAQLLLNTVN